MPPKREKEPTDRVQQFRQLKLHDDPRVEPDNLARPFVCTAKVREEHKKPIYGCAFNQYADNDDEQILATVGAEFLHLYHIPKDVNNILPLWSCDFPTNSKVAEKTGLRESLYTVTFAYDTYEADHKRNGLKVLCGGQLGNIYVIDFETRQLCNRLKSIGNDVNELRMCPTNSNLVASASTDRSIRVHHIRNESPLIVIGGQKCHSGSILTVDWHFSGSYLISSGFDHQVMRWDLSTPACRRHVETACDILSKGIQNKFVQMHQETDNEDGKKDIKPKKEIVDDTEGMTENDIIKRFADSMNIDHNNVFPIYIPSGIACDLHDDYTDCVRVLSGTDYILSKSCAADKAINFWKFGPPQGQKVNEEAGPVMGPERCTTRFSKRSVPGGDPFFVKFDVDPRRRWLVTGTSGGLIHFYDLTDLQKESSPALSPRVGRDTVRQVAFSPCGRFLCAVSDEANVCRFDRVRESVNQADLKKFQKEI